MRTIRILFIAILFHTNLVGQETTGNSSGVTHLLKGTWYVVNSWPSTKDTLVFKRESKVPNNWGDRIEISETGEIVDAYSAPCGNDTRIHKINGSWTLDKTESIITTTIPIYLDRPKNKILKLTADILVLERIE